MPEGLNYGKEDRRALDADRQILSAKTDDLDVLDLWPGGATLFGGATTTETGPGAGVNADALVLADAATHYARWNRRVRSSWTNHKLAFTVYYTAPAGSTNNFRLVLSVEAMKSGANMSTGYVVDSPVALVPGPAAAWGLLTATAILGAIPLTTETAEVISIRVLRTGTHADDTNTNACHVLLVVVEPRPA